MDKGSGPGRPADATMTEYDIAGPTRVCAATGRELKPGDRYYAVLTQEDGKLVRRDYAAEAWTGPPPGAFAHWSGRIRAAEPPRRTPVNDELLLDCFRRLHDSPDPDSQNFRYVAALLLMRRKRFRFEDVARDPSGRDLLILKDVRTGTVYQVADPRLTDEQTAAVQAEIFRVLGWD